MTRKADKWLQKLEYNPGRQPTTPSACIPFTGGRPTAQHMLIAATGITCTASALYTSICAVADHLIRNHT
jgi:hypothetical protein